MTNKVRHIRILIALATAIVLVSSVVCLGLEADHICIGGGCRVCCQILNQLSLLKNAAAVGAGLCAAFSVVVLLACVGTNGNALWAAGTLVSHKVKLSN